MAWCSIKAQGQLYLYLKCELYINSTDGQTDFHIFHFVCYVWMRHKVSEDSPLLRQFAVQIHVRRWKGS